MTDDRCLLRLAQLTLENEILLNNNVNLKRQNSNLEEVIKSITKENNRYRDTLDRCQTALGAVYGE